VTPEEYDEIRDRSTAALLRFRICRDALDRAGETPNEHMDGDLAALLVANYDAAQAALLTAREEADRAVMQRIEQYRREGR
jgi:hypothetical protein